MHWVAPRPRPRARNFLATGVCQGGAAGGVDLAAGTTSGGAATHPFWLAGLQVRAPGPNPVLGPKSISWRAPPRMLGHACDAARPGGAV